MNQAVILDMKISSSIRVYTSGMLFILFIYLVAPIHYPYSGTLEGFLYIFLSVISVFIGLILGANRVNWKTTNVKFSISKKKLYLLFKVLVILVILGVLLRVYDKYILRGASLFLDLVENRELLASQEANIFSVISSFLYPFSFILPFFYLVLRKYKMVSRTTLLALLPFILFPVIDNVAFGSRSSILVFIVLMYFYLNMLGLLKIKFNIKTIVTFSLIVGLLMVFNGYMFSVRTELLGMDPVASTKISGYAKFAYLNLSVQMFLYDIKDTFVYFFLLGSVNFAQYFIHGVFELLYLVENFNLGNVLYGQIDFFVFIKFFTKLLPLSYDPSLIETTVIRSGVYTTFFGPPYYDFGFFGLFFSLCFGFFVGFIERKVRFNIALVPLYAFLLVILFFMPVVSLFVSAQGTYLIISFLMFYSISLFLKFDKSQSSFFPKRIKKI